MGQETVAKLHAFEIGDAVTVVKLRAFEVGDGGEIAYIRGRCMQQNCVHSRSVYAMKLRAFEIVAGLVHTGSRCSVDQTQGK